MKKNESGVGLIVILILLAIVLIGGGLVFMQKKSSPSISTSPGENVQTSQSSSTSSVKSSTDIDTNLIQLDKESSQVDASLNDTPIDVMKD